MLFKTVDLIPFDAGMDMMAVLSELSATFIPAAEIAAAAELTLAAATVVLDSLVSYGLATYEPTDGYAKA